MVGERLFACAAESGNGFPRFWWLGSRAFVGGGGGGATDLAIPVYGKRQDGDRLRSLEVLGRNGSVVSWGVDEVDAADVMTGPDCDGDLPSRQKGARNRHEW